MKQLGVRMVYDSLNGDANGALWNPISMDATTKTRSNARTAYWDSASNRSNLHLLTGQQVTKLITTSSYGGVSISGVEVSVNLCDSILPNMKDSTPQAPIPPGRQFLQRRR
jgi:hypothetical protein